MIGRALTVLTLLLVCAHASWAQSTATTAPAVKIGVDVSRLSRIDEVVEVAIADRKLPGAVVLVGRGDAVLYEKAYGRRAERPAVEPMTLDTMFDAASLTKSVATTTSVMKLVEDGRLRLNDRVALYVPGFERYGKRDITIRHLLTHNSGLRPDLDLADEWVGYETAIARAVEEVPVAAPGERFIYSDINFFLLGEIVRRASGMGLDKFATRHVFAPLRMNETTFLPPASWRPRIAPTQACTPYGWPCEGPNMTMLRGVVHDPTARRMGGVAGHAGVFTTAHDLSRFARMLLNGGTLDGARVLTPLTVRTMTAPQTSPELANVRALGWDIDSTFSSNRGELLPFGSFGHTGFTGTSLWVDPATNLYIVFLSSRLHPEGKGDVTPLRARVATIAASSVVEAAADRPGGAHKPWWTMLPSRPAGELMSPAGEVPRRKPVAVMTGLDVLRGEQFKRLLGKKVALVTNHTGRARDGATTIDLLNRAPGVTLVALLSPEHGIRGVLDEKVPSSRDERTGLPIHSLYGDARRPTAEMLSGIDAVVIDIQDVGARFYTYITTTAYVIEEAAKRGIEVVLLDRPNPVNGWQIEGPVQDDAVMGFTGYFKMPIRHALTLGELATLFNAENRIGAKLTVVRMSGWSREAWFDETGLPWINPSPNMRNLIQATVYPGIGALEGTNISVGRGTDTPFEQIGAPWIDGVRLAERLNARRIPGIRFYSVSFTPTSSKHANQVCQGVFMIVTDRDALRPVRVGVEVASALVRLHPNDFDLAKARTLLGSQVVLDRIRKGDDPAGIAAAWAADEARWRLLRAKYLLYY
jgi:uncharacterized protein YbbC (DUF1343 family)/CubicO group peptidase (beta-lactamase class C family)